MSFDSSISARGGRGESLETNDMYVYKTLPFTALLASYSVPVGYGL